MLQRRISYLEKESRKYLPDQKEVLHSLKERDIQTYRIAEYLQNTSGSLVSQNNRVQYLSFSRNFGKEAAMLAGLRASTGDYVTIMDVDLQDPPLLIVEILEQLRT